MSFNDVIGQDEIKAFLRRQVKEGRLPHALLLSGGEGRGKFALAFALARYLLCQHPEEEDACNKCNSCKMTEDLSHPDLHFIYPVIRRKGKRGDPVSTDFITEWRKMVKDSRYFNMDTWLAAMGAENQQAMIYTAESDTLTEKLMLQSAMGGYKVVILWLPEKLHPTCANKMLKLLEEPPRQTIFLLVSREPDSILPTIYSRTQRIEIPPVTEEAIEQALITRYSVVSQEAALIAQSANGNVLAALENIHLNEDRELFFSLFTSLMRLAYMRNIRELKEWSLTLADMGRERQKNFLAYVQRLLRENFIYNFHLTGLNYMNREEAQFATRFARFINERNVMELMEEFDAAWQDIARNVNAKMVFFDLTLKVIVLLIR